MALERYALRRIRAFWPAAALVLELTITDSLHGPVVESRIRGGHARWASVHGHRGTGAASLAEAVMALEGVVDCRVIDVGGSELLTVGRFAGPVNNSAWPIAHPNR